MKYDSKVHHYLSHPYHCPLLILDGRTHHGLGFVPSQGVNIRIEPENGEMVKIILISSIFLMENV